LKILIECVDVISGNFNDQLKKVPNRKSRISNTTEHIELTNYGFNTTEPHRLHKGVLEIPLSKFSQQLTKRRNKPRRSIQRSLGFRILSDLATYRKRKTKKNKNGETVPTYGTCSGLALVNKESRYIHSYLQLNPTIELEFFFNETTEMVEYRLNKVEPEVKELTKPDLVTNTGITKENLTKVFHQIKNRYDKKILADIINYCEYNDKVFYDVHYTISENTGHAYSVNFMWQNISAYTRALIFGEEFYSSFDISSAYPTALYLLFPNTKFDKILRALKIFKRMDNGAKIKYAFNSMLFYEKPSIGAVLGMIESEFGDTGLTNNEYGFLKLVCKTLRNNFKGGEESKHQQLDPIVVRVLNKFIKEYDLTESIALYEHDEVVLFNGHKIPKKSVTIDGFEFKINKFDGKEKLTKKSKLNPSNRHEQYREMEQRKFVSEACAEMRKVNVSKYKVGFKRSS
jgi:hypothetical protein